MRITKLSLTNVRAFKHAELSFKPGMNLLVGLNGIGKTTVLNVLCNMLAPVLARVNGLRGDSAPLSVSDIRQNTEALDVGVECVIGDSSVSSSYHKPRESFLPKETGLVRGAVTHTPENRTIRLLDPKGDAVDQLHEGSQLALFFSTKRTIPSDAKVSNRKAGGGGLAALADSLSSRELRLADIAEWLKAQEELGKENPLFLKHVKALRKAASNFLPDCRNLRAVTEPRPDLLVDKKVHGKPCTLSVRQLSDGERSMLVLVLVIAQKLSQNWKDLADPIRQASAVILIDELDLHLHPRWQRTIVERLTATFPCCQFIATTHSPQIVAAVEPEQVLLLTTDGATRPDRTLGMDSNWILRHLMETDERPAAVAEAIRKIQALISEGYFAKARKLIAADRQRWPDLPDWAVLETRMLRMEALAK